MKKRKVVIDCDPGIDDVLALLLAFSSPELEVIGITIVAGNVPVEIGAKNARKALQMVGRLDIPIYLGDNKPIKRTLVTAQETHGKDGIGECNFEEIDVYQNSISAVEYLVNTFSENKDIELIALGPLTNIAKSLAINLNLYNHFDKLVTMGGAFKSHGNCSPVAEYNYWVDPHGADYVYKNIKCPIHMIGLDVTRKIVLNPNIREGLRLIDTKLSNFIYKITQFYVDFHWEWEGILGCVINDPLAVAYFIDDGLCNGFDAYTEIVTDGPAMGQSIIDSKHFYKADANATILTQVDAEKFMNMFLNRIEPDKFDVLKRAKVI